ncbi:hypothetical protein RND81_11G100900 [Saponaria officinalis]|uniref:Endonuclease/exonuclease/phosphatase domain-containing protein n=1 Tax=Saponaria officinalis TaxID=3572 RepID=A0AAW1HLZ8_SAPOF
MVESGCFGIQPQRSNNAAVRQGLWDSLVHFGASVGPWIVMGDFNVIRYEWEKISHTPVTSDLLAFNDCILSCGLDDMNCTGCEYPWHNRQESGSVVYSKLDRVMINNDWSRAFTQTSAQFLPPGLSHHSPSLVTFHGDPLPRKWFSYLNCWADHPNFRDLVLDAWDCEIMGTPMFRLMRKLRNVKRKLKLLHHTQFSDIGKRVQRRKEELADCYTALLANPLSDSLIQQEKQASIAYWKLKEAETKILTQRAKLHDMKYGEMSSQ